MFAADDEEGDFTSPTGGAKLASLFGLDQAASKGNESFQYTAPKQPRKSSGNSGPHSRKPAPLSSSPAVIFATAVQAYRYVNGQYVKQGKVGAAVLGNHTTKEYKLLLYVSQQKQVAAARIHSGFILTVQPSNYCTFYDDQRQNWSLMFESEKAATDFCKEVCLAKVNCGGPLDSVLIQDLLLGEGKAVENGDSLEVAYTGWLLQNQTIGTMFDSNLNKDKLLRLKLGSGKVIKGWEEGMLNMCKGGRRLMVIPPSLAYGSQGVPNHVPPDSTLIFEAEIRRVKCAKDGSSRDSAAPSPAPSVDSLGPSELNQPLGTAPPTNKPGEPPLRAKSNSLNEQLSNPDASKAKLISRMAKMGQPMLPFFTGPASHPDSSDSELEDPSVSRHKEHSSAPSPQPVHISSSPISVHGNAFTCSDSYICAGLTLTPSNPPTVGSALLPVTMATVNPQPLMPGAVHAFQPVGQMYSSQTVPYQGNSDVTSFLMTEARQHNTEIRLAVGKVADKLDHLSSKMDEVQKQGGLSSGLSNVSMETAMIMHNIQRIIQENECLKKEVFEKSSRIEEQNRKIGELINQNQRYMEQSNMLMEQRNDSLKNSSEQCQARILQGEQDKVRLSEELASSTARVSELQLELTSQQQKAAVLQTKLNSALQDIQQHSTHITSLETQLLEFKETAERVQSQYKTEKQKRKETELKLNGLEEELQDAKTEKDSMERTFSERKRKWQAERQRSDEELEEVRRAAQQEMDNLRNQLRKARTSTDHAATGQLTQMQAELEQEWQMKCDRTLAAAREQHRREMTELTEHRDTLQIKLTQLQEKFNALRQSRDSEERLLVQDQDQKQELDSLREKCSALGQRAEYLRQQGEARVSELERKLAERQPQADTTEEVKRVMNGVFQSLRGEFDLNETYTGSAVLRVLVNTIKNITLQLLTRNERSSSEHSEKDEDAEKDEENEGEEQKVQINGSREEEETNRDSAGQDEEVEEDPAEEEAEETKDLERQDQIQQEVVEDVTQEVVVKEKEVTVHVSTEENVPDQVVESDGESSKVGTREEDINNDDITPKQEVMTEKSDDTTSTQEVKVIDDPEVTVHVSKEENVPDQVVESDGESSKVGTREEDIDNDDITPKQEVVTDKSDDATSTQEVKVIYDPSVEAEVTMCGPPVNPPPPPPNASQDDSTNLSAELSSTSERVPEENGEGPFLQSSASPQPTPAPAADEEEEELSLKGCPPPAPLFGEDSEDEDLDWLG
ncbi:FK506-binding protein 15 [Triplophysa tibetana]|uniref:peptidylprolyl isomerase n=1 Tax=Triplophysa tibetana TaxID=1572043 RepID=A0A5A9NVN2_9TELE|nr:FK506-binding protein 15 [Triplophysa tibetana]